MKSIVRIVVILACTIASFTAAAQKPTTAIQLNDYLVAITDSLYKGGQAWGKALNSAVQSKEYGSLATPRINMEQFIIRKKAAIKALKDINGSENLRKAMLDFLDFETKMIKETFQPLETLTATSTKEEVKKAIDNLMAMAEFEKDNLGKVNTAQEEYAKRNGFTIAKPDDNK